MDQMVYKYRAVSVCVQTESVSTEGNEKKVEWTKFESPQIL